MACTPVASKILPPCIVLVLALVLPSCYALASASRGKIGVDYGLKGDNLLTPEQTVKLLCSNGIRRVRIYEARPDVIQAFANSGIGLTIGVRNEEVPKLAANLGEAFNWVTKYVLPFPTSGISTILVGNEWLLDPSNDPSLLVPAMQNIYKALSTMQLFDIHLGSVKVSTPHSFAVLGNSSFPPSTATFAEGVVAVMRPLLDFLENTGSFFMVNIFPYFSYLADEGVSLEFALFESTEAKTDPNSKLKYTNLFDMQLDAVYAAITSLLSSSPSPCAGNSSSAGEKTSNEHVHLEAASRKSPSMPARKPPRVYVGETGWSSGIGSPHTPPGGRNTQVLPTGHSASVLSSTQETSASSNAHAHHNHLDHDASLQNTTPARSATLPSPKLTSFSTPRLSSSLVSHDLFRQTMPFTVAPSSSKVQPGVTPSSSAPSSSTISTTSSATSTISTASSLTSSATLAHARSSSSSASISHFEERRFSPRAQYTTNAEAVDQLAHCTCNTATVENARTYNQNLIRHVLQAKGTPAHPSTPIEAYIFALFNEDLKDPGTEQHFGLFFPNGTAVYPINFNDAGNN